MHLRRKPYTLRGMRRVPCAKCGGKPSCYQWQACADLRVYRALCVECDIGLNEIVMRYMFGRKRDRDLRAYAKKVRFENSGAAAR